MEPKVQYKVTIEKIEQKEVTKKGDYSRLSYAYLSEDQYMQLPYEEKKEWNTNTLEGEKPYRKALYGHLPDTTEIQTIEAKIYQQTVEELDIAKIVAGINNARGY